MNSIKIDKTTFSIAGGIAAGVGLYYVIKGHLQQPQGISSLSTSSIKPVTNETLNSQLSKTLRVCVTGAAGQIGYAFLPLLCSGSVFGNDVKIQLRLLDVPGAIGTLEGVVLELQDGAYPLVEDIKFGDNPREMFAGCDVVVFIGGFPRKQGMERKDLLKINGGIFSEQGRALDEVAKKTVKAVVVANPANTNCLILQRNAPSIPKENFTCLTRLDQNRAVAQLSLKTGIPVTKVKNVIIWGNHSATQYPDVSHGTINDRPVRSVVSDDAYLNNDYIERIQKRGAEIIKHRGGSSVFSAANAVKDHLRDWFLGTKNGSYVSMGVVSDGSYNIPEGIIFSYPVTCENFSYKIVKGLSWDLFSTEKIRLTTQELVEEKNEAVSLEAERLNA